MRRTTSTLALALLVAWFARPASTQDLGLDLPVERPTRAAPVQSKTYAGVGRTVTRDPRVVPDPPEPPHAPDPTPPTFYGSELRASGRSILYVIDVSGSMAWDVQPYAREDGSTTTGSRLDRAKAEVSKSIALLPPDWSFDLIAYDCSTSQWSAGLAPADEPNKASARRWVAALRPGGGTGTGYAVALGLRELPENRLVVLLSDGAPNCLLGGLCGSDQAIEHHRAVIREANVQRAVVDTFGIGCYGEFRRFMEGVASDAGGTYVDVR